MKTYTAQFQLPPTVFDNTITDRLFGTGLVGRTARLDPTSTVAPILEKVDVGYLRYPGGTETERYFSPANPDAAISPAIDIPGERASLLKLSDFNAYTAAQNIQSVIVLPTFRYFDPGRAAQDYLSVGAEAEIRAFIAGVLGGRWGAANVHAFEIGNEWWNELWAALPTGDATPGGWTPAQFAKLQAGIVGIVNSEIAASLGAANPAAPDIWVQGVGQGDTDVDNNGMRDNVEIRTALEQANVMGFVDGVIDHFYQDIRFGSPMAIIDDRNGSLVASTRTGNLQSDGWNVVGPTATVDVITTEWNIRADDAKDPLTMLPYITGLERLPIFLALFADMVRAGVDDAMVFAAQAAGVSNGTLSQLNETTLTPTGLLFRMMRDALPGTRLVDPDGNGTLTEREMAICPTSTTAVSNCYGLTYTFSSTNKVVVYYSNALNEQLSLNLGQFAPFINSGYHIHGTILGAIAGANPLDVAVDGQLEALSLSALEGSVVDGTFQFTLDAFETIQIVLTRGAGVTLEGDDQNVIADRLVGSNFADTLFGNAGNDTLDGSGAPDTLVGGAGADVLIGGTGTGDIAAYWDSTTGIRADLLSAGSNTGFAAGDTYNGIEGLAGTDSADFLFGSNATNTLIGMAGNDVLSGRGANDTLQGDAGNDSLEGGSGVDLLYGGDGDDTLRGDLGVDQLFGGSGSDQMIGDFNGDQLSGGSGADQFIFRDLDKYLPGRSVADRIATLSASVGDRLVFEAADLGLTGTVLPDTSWLASPGAASVAHGRFLYDPSTRNLFWDHDGNSGTANRSIVIFDVDTTVSLGSFILI
jgi:Ca2+-binding RTX toxin-like protein